MSAIYDVIRNLKKPAPASKPDGNLYEVERWNLGRAGDDEW